MYEIKEFQYKKEALNNLRQYRYGNNWPIVYILNGGKEAYVGESTSAFKRANQHLKNPNRAKLSKMLVIADDEYNKSATLDIESMLIKYIASDGKFLLQNSNTGISNTDYFDRERYRAKFETVWKDLMKRNLVHNEISDIENSDLFKFSPYKALTEDQKIVTEEIIESIKDGGSTQWLITGEPGTGKTIVATYLLKAIVSKSWGKDLKVGLVVPMTSLRKTLKKVFKQVKGLSSQMVLGPNEIVGKHFDILLVDEAHRLQRRVNLTNYVPFDNANKHFNLDNTSNQLDWVMQSTKTAVLFYDPKQSIRPADIRSENFHSYPFQKRNLISQMRVLGGQDYIDYIHSLLDGTASVRKTFETYDFKLFDKLEDMVSEITRMDKSFGVSRLLAGFAWKWSSKGKKGIDFDIEIEGLKLKWNGVTQDWVNSPNAVKEVGCIHTIQGYDLNYAGVILGPEISYNFESKKIVVDKAKYEDFNGKRAITSPDELELYVTNIYKTLLTRGIKGTFVYAVDESMRRYLSSFL